MEERAQVSFDYLIILTFVLALVVVVSVLVNAMRGIVLKATGKVLDYRTQTLTSILK